MIVEQSTVVTVSVCHRFREIATCWWKIAQFSSHLPVFEASVVRGDRVRISSKRLVARNER